MVIYFFLRIRDRISAVTVVPMVSAVLCIAVVFLGEFERGAYTLPCSPSPQIGLAVLMISPNRHHRALDDVTAAIQLAHRRAAAGRRPFWPGCSSPAWGAPTRIIPIM